LSFEKYDSLILSLARKSANNVHDVEDLQQIARIHVWKILEEWKPDNAGYIRVSIDNLFKKEYNKKRAQKRDPRTLIRSLQEELAEWFNIGDTLWEEDVIHDEWSMIELLKDNLIENYGKHWISKIGDESRPIYTVRRIIKSAIEDISQLSLEDIPEKVDREWFTNMWLWRLLWVYYKNSPSRAVMDIYKGSYEAWNFARVPNWFWNWKDGYTNALSAMQWFIEKHNIKTIEDCRKVGYRNFSDEWLVTMLRENFSDSPYLALKAFFPELRQWWTKWVPKNYFANESNRKNSLIDYGISNWIGNLENLSTEELHDSDFREFSTKSSLSKHWLRTVYKYSNGSTYKMFNDFFPQVKPWSMNTKSPWENDPKELAAEAVRWLFNDYLKIQEKEIPEYATNSLFRRLNLSWMLTNKRIWFNWSTYSAVENAYPWKFSRSDFSRWRKTKKLST